MTDIPEQPAEAPVCGYPWEIVHLGVTSKITVCEVAMVGGYYHMRSLIKGS